MQGTTRHKNHARQPRQLHPACPLLLLQYCTVQYQYVTLYSNFDEVSHPLSFPACLVSLRVRSDRHGNGNGKWQTAIAMKNPWVGRPSIPNPFAWPTSDCSSSLHHENLMPAKTAYHKGFSPVLIPCCWILLRHPTFPPCLLSLPLFTQTCLLL